MKPKEPRSMALSALRIESAASSALTVWTGMGFLSALAGGLGGSLNNLTTITWMPWAGSFASLIAGLFISRIRSNQSAALLLLALGRGAWAIPLSWTVWLLLQGDAAYSTDSYIKLMGWTSLFASVLNGMGLVALKGWIRTLIPASFHGYVLALRHQAAMIASIAANGLAALLCSVGPGNSALAPRITPLGVGFLTVIAAGTSLLALLTIQSKSERAWFSNGPLLNEVLGPIKIPRFRKLLAFALAYAFACHLSLPYLGFHLTRELNIPMSTTLIWAGCMNLGGAISAPFWGKRTDLRGGPARVILFATLMMAAAPWIYAKLDAQALIWIGPIEHMLRGALFGGYQIAMLKLIYGRSSDSEPHASGAIALHQAGVGLSSGMAAFLGGQLVAVGSGDLNIPQLLVISGVAQIAVTATGLVLIPITSGTGASQRTDPKSPH